MADKEFYVTSEELALEKTSAPEKEAVDAGLPDREAAYWRQEYEERVTDIIALSREFRATSERMRKQLEAAHRRLEEVTIHRDELLRSTFWRVTGPLRKAIGIVRRRP